MAKKNKKSASKIWVPSSEIIEPPVVTRAQTLPLNKLPWSHFQRLCARLAQKAGDVEHSQEYGIPGQSQEGIDIYIRLRSTNRYSVWQTKRYQEIKNSDIASAVDEFINGDWINKSDEFVFCISAEIEERNLADEIEKQNQRLRNKNVAFIPKGITQLSELLKQHPDLVDDFFGRAWVKEFCGQSAANQLSHRRLNHEQVVQLRSMLHRCYTQHFEAVDPGLPSITSSVFRSSNPLPLSKRFILPDVLESKQITHLQRIIDIQNQHEFSEYIDHTNSESKSKSIKDPTRITTSVSEIRKPAVEWLVEGNLSIIIGDPGIGKSTLLRYLLLDLLSEEPQQESVAIKWGYYLPVWIPFPMWTRMVAENESTSLYDVLKTWLNKVNATKDVVTLVKEAMEDSRLIIFVDGLDEWSNETAARTTVTLLEQFVGEKNIPAIASSRPLGFERLGGLSSRWRCSKLAGFTKDQQSDFAYRWFLHQNQIAIESDNLTPNDEVEKVSMGQAKQLIDDIHKDARIVKLAEIPLLLSGLITMSVQRVRLPRNRFKAYEELTRILLQEQPQRREKAAQARFPSSTISQETKERALAHLAYSIHQLPGSDTINLSLARTLLSDFLVILLQKEPCDAIEWAEKIITIGTETMGILVEKSPQEIGFHHRAFQEFLAASHVHNLSFDEQKQIVSKHFVNPQWHDILLCLFHLNTRNREVDELVEIIERLPLSPDLFLARQLFSAEVAFSDLHCSAKYSAKIAKEIFKEIEIGHWMPLRELLLERVLDGLFSDILRSDVETQIEQWYPERFKYRQGVYNAISFWPNNSDTVDILWRGLFNEDDSNKRAAAEALAKICHDDPEVGDKLFSEIMKPNYPNIIPFLLHAFCVGWSKDPRIPKLLQETRNSIDLEIKIVGIKHQVLRNKQDSSDRQFLLNLISEHNFGIWQWREDITDTITIGWPKDQEIKNLAIQSLKSSWNEGPIDREYAGSILFKGFPQDDDVAKVVAEIFKRETYPQHKLGSFHDHWDLLARSFVGNKILSEAVDEWFEKKPERSWDYEVCLISKSERAKQNLLKLNKTSNFDNIHQINCLIDGWGLNDPEIFETLTSISKDAKASFISHLLPEIIKDRATCRERLIHYLKTESNYIANLALKGLVKLGSNENDSDVIDLAFQKFGNNEESQADWGGMSTLISNFSKDTRVRNAALNQIKRLKAGIATIALTYKDDLEIRREVTKVICSLPSKLRLKIVDNLSLQANEDDFSYKLISKYDADSDAIIKCKSAIGYANTSMVRGKNEAELIDKFTNGLRAVGFDHDERRQAAFAGLLELNRIDKVIETEKSESHGIKYMDLSGIRDINFILASQIGKKWSLIQSAFGNSFWDHTGYVSDEMLEEIVYQTKDANIVEDIISKMKKNSGGFNLPALRVRSRFWKGTDQLCQLCMDLINSFRITNWVETSPRILAAEILSEQYIIPGSETQKKIIETVEKANNPSAHIIALAGNKSSYSILNKFREENIYKQLLLPAKVNLHCIFDSTEKFIKSFGQLYEILNGDIWEFLPFCIKPILSKIQQDEELRNELLVHLERNPSISEKCNIPQLLTRTGNQSDRLRNWCKEEYRIQTSGHHLPDIGFDIFTGHTQSVGHVMLDILKS